MGIGLTSKGITLLCIVIFPGKGSFARVQSPLQDPSLRGTARARKVLHSTETQRHTETR